jgi:pyruvate/2-oxoglutarate dehydrogenase complex dihydrolipoamide dehydrogenase (E3) component
MKNRYDVICIGAGSGGLATGLAAAELGLKVLIIDKNKNKIGGECVHTGCIPSKALLYASRNYSKFDQAIKYVKSVQQKVLLQESPGQLQAKGVDLIFGTAQFIGRNQIKVAGNEYTSHKIVVATGSRPRTIEVENHGSTIVVTNEQLFDIKNPTHLAIIGGGPIGCEMAQAFINLGIKVTLLERGPHLLDKDPDFAGNLICKKLAQAGVVVCLNSEVEKIDYGNRLHIKQADKNETTKLSESVSHLLMAVGRVYDYKELNLAAAQIKTDNQGQPILDSARRSESNSSIIFAGDASRDPLFSHMAEEHARTNLRNWLNPFKTCQPRKKIVPWITFTNYEVATFGYSIKQLRKQGVKFRIIKGDFADNDRAMTDDYQDAAYQLLVAKKPYSRRERMCGGTVVAPKAGELIQELMLAQENNLSIASLRNKFYAYPTMGQVWQSVLLHDQSEQSLTPRVKSIIARWFRLIN